MDDPGGPVRGARGDRISVPVDRIDREPADAGSGNQLLRDRHASRGLSAARHRRRVSGRVAGTALPGKEARACRARDDGDFRGGVELLRWFRGGARRAHDRRRRGDDRRPGRHQDDGGLVRQSRNRPCDVAPADELAVRGDAGSADPGLYRPASRMARGDAVQRRLRHPRALRFHVCFGARAAAAADGDRPRRAPRCRSASGHDRRR